jgi:Undecaprenyl-phosphate glucose phosphotransferase
LAFQLATTPVRICLAPDLIGFEFPKRSYTQVADVPTLLLFDRPISGWSYVFKAVEDYVLALLALIFFAPLLLLVALAIKLESPGPVFFKQQRMGFNNKLFEIWKFRTMCTDLADPDCEVQTTRNDSRVTRVGRFLRRSSLDEFAQLFNVLRGDMSLVGPRPHALETKAEGCLFAEVVDHYVARHKVKPGITGWAQVNGWRGETRTIEDIEKRVEYDLYYIENWSVWFDLVIILKTFVVVFSTKNAY